jgi:predicted transcriptional regulator
MEHPLVSDRERDWSAPDSDVISLEDQRATRIFEALTCPTRREILTQLWEQPLSSSELAEQLGCSVQNTQYHLDTLVDSQLVEVVDTTLSTRGCQMSLYAPAEALVVVVAPHNPTAQQAADGQTAAVDAPTQLTQSGALSVGPADSD